MTLKAPVIIGRLIWTVSPTQAVGNTPVWLLVTVGSVAVVFIVGWVLLTMRRSPAPVLPAVRSQPRP